MKDLITKILDDGNGNISSMRVIVILVIGAVIVSKFVNAYITKQPIIWNTDDWQIIGVALGSKLFQNYQEQQSTKETK